MIEFQISINPDIMTASEMKMYLETQPLNTNADLSLEVRKNPVIYRGIDPTILVALIGVLGVGIGSLLTGLLQIAQKSKEGKIIMQTHDGQRLEVPSDTTMDEIDQLITKLKKLDDTTVKILIP